MPDWCAAYDCSNHGCAESRQRGITFHLFPKAPDRRRQWELAIGRKNFVAKNKTHICSEHFRPEDFDRTGQTVRLRAGVVPTIFSFTAKRQKAVKRRMTATSRRAEYSQDLFLDKPKPNKKHQKDVPAARSLTGLSASTELSLKSTVETQRSLELGATGERSMGLKRKATDHTYGLPSCSKAIKDKFDAAAARMRKLQRDKINALTRERRAKKNMQSLLEELKTQTLLMKD